MIMSSYTKLSWTNVMFPYMEKKDYNDFARVLAVAARE